MRFRLALRPSLLPEDTVSPGASFALSYRGGKGKGSTKHGFTFRESEVCMLADEGAIPSRVANSTNLLYLSPGLAFTLLLLCSFFIILKKNQISFLP